MTALAKKKVLIVEDEYILYQELVEFFEEKGYKIIRHTSDNIVDNYDDAVMLIRKEAPDIAIIDIQIKGNKDGIELSAYIKENYTTLIVILTVRDNHENLERAKQVMADGFVIKEGKPVNKRQLWANISLAIPRFEIKHQKKTVGGFFKVREIDIKTLAANNNHKESKAEVTAIDLETFIKWECITYILSYNSKQSVEGNNNVLIYTNLQNKGYIYRSTIGSLIGHLPDNFIRFDQSTIVNAYHISARGKGNNLYYVGNKSFKISETYKMETSEKLEELILK